MSTLNTAVNITSKDILPVSVNFTASNAYAISGGNADWKKVFIPEGESVSLSNKNCGPNGAIVFAQSVITNTPGAKIQLYGAESIEDSGVFPWSFATLHPGDTTILQLSPQQKNVVAKTTQGSAYLNYLFCDRQGQYGQSTIILFPGDNDWMYFVFDVAFEETPKVIDLGFQVSGWTYENTFIIQDKSYCLKFYDGVSVYKYVFLNSKGDVFSTKDIATDGGTNLADDNMDNIRKSFAVFYNLSGNVNREITVFDGDEIYTHTFSGTTDVEIWQNDDGCSKDGSFIVKVSNYEGVSGQTAYFVINKDKKYLISSINDSSSLTVSECGVYSFGNFIFLITYDNDAEIYKTMQFWSNNGTLLKNVDLNAYNFVNLDYYYYGNGKIQVVFNPDDTNLPWYFFNYNEINNLLIGEDFNWFHYRGDNFTDYYVYNQFKNNETANDDTFGSFTSESIAILTYSGTVNNSYGDFLNAVVNYADIDYVFDKDVTFSRYILNDWSNAPKYIRMVNQWDTHSIYPTNNDITINYGTGTQNTGSLHALTINKATSAVTSYEIISDLSVAATGYYDIRFVPFGDYKMYRYKLSGTTRHYVAFKDGIKDSFTTTSSASHRTRFNNLYIREWDDNKSWYYNTLTNKFVNLNAFYPYKEFPFYASDSGNNTGIMAIISNPESNIYHARILSAGGVISADKLMPSVTIGEVYVNWWMGQDYFVWAYQRNTIDYNYTFNIYDSSLNLVNSIDTNYNNIDNSNIIKNRFYFRLTKGGNAIHIMITPTSIEEIKNNSGTYYLTLNDDAWEDW